MPKRRRSSDSDSDWDPAGQNSADELEETENKRPTKRRRVSATTTEPATKKTKPRKKRRQKARPAKFTKKLFADLKRPLNQHVQTFAKMVDRDWHDGYEEQGEELVSYFESLRTAFQTIYDFARVHRRDYKMCHELLKYIGDTWTRINCVPARLDISSMGDSDADWELHLTETNSTRTFRACECMGGLLSYFWPLLLLSVCADESVDDPVSDEELNQWIRDAMDFDVTFDLSVPDDDDEKDFDDDEPPQFELIGLRNGVGRLDNLIKSNAWRNCPTTKKTHRMRRCIDRRFDGPRHLRTRDYGWSDEEDDFGVDMDAVFRCLLGGGNSFFF